MNKALRPGDGGVSVSLRVSPGAKRSALEGSYGEDAIRLKVAAPPVDGKANAEVVRGPTSRDKVVLVRGIKLPEVETILAGKS